MHKFIAAFALAMLAVTGVQAQQPQPAQDSNLLAFANGALVERASSNYGGGWDTYLLLTEEAGKGWANAEGDKPPFEIVFSLPDRAEFHRFMFDTAAAESPERAAKAIDIQVSEDGKAFKTVMTVDLKSDTNDQEFKSPQPATGKFLKLIMRTNHGDQSYWEVLNARAYGVELTHTPMPNVTGTYDSADYGKFHLLQEGAQLSGCYEYNDGLVQGGLEQHAMRLTWHETGDDKTGPAIMVLARDGKSFKGFWRFNRDGDWSLNWNLKKISNEVGSCPHWKPKTASANLVAKGLASEGRVRLYGINFDTDSDRIRADAKPQIDQLAAALKSNAGWKITIEGHTDATGSAPHNRELSNRRAVSVKAALVAAGIAADRLTSNGFGPDKPAASNDTEIGRAQNRRVEVVRQ